MEEKKTELRTHNGSCHCGAIRFEVDLAIAEGASRCNCTICTKVSQVGKIVAPSALRLLSGKENVSIYTWGSEMSKRTFCKTCGVHCFGHGHLAQLGGDFASVNMNCLDDVDVSTLSLVHWDGRHDNWQAGPRTTPWPIDSTRA